MRQPATLHLPGVMLLLLTAATPALAAGPEPAAPEGFLYGTVHTEGGRKYTGQLRWGEEEAFWDDLFNGTKSKLPYIDRLPEERRRKREISILGLRIGYTWDNVDSERQFVARFGDIREIVPGGGEKVDVVMKSGTTYRLDGGSNDIGADIHVQDPDVGEVDVAWKRIERIVFAAAPAGAHPEASRLHGEVETEEGTFRGFVQWDSQECLSTDKLDGESEDGKLSIAMGRIRSIEKKNRNGVWVDLKDGRKVALHGTNDVDSSIRGIFVEDERYGRVKVPWDTFRRVDFHDGPASGRGYAGYKPALPLAGTVTDAGGKTWKGRLVFDLDEGETWEMLNGNRDGIEYVIPFELVRSVAPRDHDSSDVTLKSGQELKLEDSQDVSEANAGVLVLLPGGSEQYVPWDRVRKIDFDGSSTASPK